jgi:hypothetical protein
MFSVIKAESNRIKGKWGVVLKIRLGATMEEYPSMTIHKRLPTPGPSGVDRGDR